MRKFSWCRQEIAENCALGGEHVHIVITTLGGREISPPCKKRTLHLFFHDLIPDQIRVTKAFENDPKRGQELIDGCFTEAQAQYIVWFVETALPNETIIVNCEAGVSRSPAVVMAYRKSQGESIEEIYKKAWPNIHVANTLGRVLGVGPFEPPKVTPGVISMFGGDES